MVISFAFRALSIPLLSNPFHVKQQSLWTNVRRRLNRQPLPSRAATINDFRSSSLRAPFLFEFGTTPLNGPTLPATDDSYKLDKTRLTQVVAHAWYLFYCSCALIWGSRSGIWYAGTSDLCVLLEAQAPRTEAC